MCPGRLQGCRRGIYGLQNWDPLRKPGQVQSAENPVTSVEQRSDNETMATKPKQGSTRKPMMAKYSYKSNKNSPLGSELSVEQKDRLTFIKEHEDNSSWWLAEASDGSVGYVPATYMMLLEQKPSALPWLKNSAAEETNSNGNNTFGAPEKPTARPYRSAYDHKDLPNGGSDKEFYCAVCEKQLNGPKPYQAHMLSKAHKEEMEFRSGES